MKKDYFIVCIALIIWLLLNFSPGIKSLVSSNSLFRDIIFYCEYLLNPPTKPNDDIVIVDIDDESLWVLQRPDYLANIVKLIGDTGQAKVIGLDILFDELKNPDPSDLSLQNIPLSCPYNPKLHPYEMKLACTISSDPISNVIISSTVEADNNRRTILNPIPALYESAWGVGSILLPQEKGDKNFYKASVYFEDDNKNFTYSFPIMMASYLNGGITLQDDILTIGDKKINISNSPDGFLYFIPKLLGPNYMFKYVTIKEIQTHEGDKQFLTKTFKNKIVLVGSSSEILADLKKTPLTEFYSNSELNGLMPGVEYHANTLYSLIHNNIYTIAPLWLNLLWGISFILLATVSILLFKSSYSYLFNISLSIICFLIGLIVQFKTSIILPVGSTITIILIIIPIAYIYRYLTIDKVFGQYVSPDVSKLIWKNRHKLILKGNKQFATIIFTDIRGFTTFSEQKEPEVVLETLNLYFEKMADIVYKTGGNLNKFIGDGLMILYGIPVNDQDNTTNALNAIKAAKLMLVELNTLNEQWTKQNTDIKLDIGIGIHSGEVIAGNIGSTKRMEYSAIGDSVNLAARLESINKEFKTNIIISQSTYELVKDSIELAFIDTVQVKGRSQQVNIYTVKENSENER